MKNKSKGIFLTILLIIGVLQALLLIFSGLIYPLIILGVASTAGKLTLLVSTLEFIPLAAALYGIWYWKKWGAYSFFVYVIISIIATYIFDVVLKLYTGYAQYVIFFDIVVAAVWFWAIRRKWSNFTN